MSRRQMARLLTGLVLTVVTLVGLTPNAQSLYNITDLGKIGAFGVVFVASMFIFSIAGDIEY